MKSGEIMVVLIVLIFAISRIVQARYGVGPRGRRNNNRGDDDRRYMPPQDDGEAERLRGEVRQLKDRIQVLERIVTDGDRNRGLALEEEIERLRDRPTIRRNQEIEG